MNIKILDKLFFGQNSKKTSQKEKNIWYFSFLILMLIPIYFIKDISIFFFQNNYIISVLALSIYVLYGIKKHTWVNGFQKFLLSIIFIALILGTSFQESKYFLNLKQYSEFHNTKVGSDLWFNLKIKDNNTYEIQVASPKDGKWVDVKKGKISALTKQRYTDTGQNYYCFYLEDYPFLNERTMVAFENAFAIAEIKFNSAHYLLSDGSDENPWK